MTKILVVDDDEGILDALSLILEEAGYHVRTTSKGDETYKKVRTFKPDIIILDVLMSGSDGRDICRYLKCDAVTKTVPVIMISAHPTAKNSVMECGANDFIAKPFDTEELLEKIEKHVKNKNI